MSAGFLTMAVAGAIFFTWTVLVLIYRKRLWALWCEPVMRYPVLIIESDDWGPGPEKHGLVLRDICKTLLRHRDVVGHPAVMTIGTVLSTPDNIVIRDSGFKEYGCKMLSDEEFGSVRQALLDGQDKGVLALQLHGKAHLWPPAFMAAAAEPGSVRDWVLLRDGFETEELPSAIQSRWINGSVLPSEAIAEGEIDVAVAGEVQDYQICFGALPAVAVPPTFIWNELVESAWVKNGVSTIITPGKRFTARDSKGNPANIDRYIINGERSESGAVYLVRDIYFEPLRSHKVEDVLIQMQQRYSIGRPALVETHRYNFIGAVPECQKSLEKLGELLHGARMHWPSLRFVSSEQLADQFRQGRGDLLENRFGLRVRAWLQRAADVSRLYKLAWLTGLILPAGLILLMLKVITSRGEQYMRGLPT